VTQSDQNKKNREVALALVALFTTGAIGFIASVQIAEILLGLIPAVPRAILDFVSTMVAGGPNIESVGVPDGPAQAIERKNASAWLSLYTLAAVERLREAAEKGDTFFEDAKKLEARYFEMQIRAEERRMRAAAGQDMAAMLNDDRKPEGLLGWRAVLDDRTTAECRDAHGKNFRADKMPAIGWPGSVHVHCRCSAGPAIPGAPLLPSA